ncbi:MAG: AI-2E family transporter [Candidatus Doudnabacteria bacterium]
MSERHDTINISTVTLLKIVFIVLLFCFLWVVRDVLLIFLIAIIISSAIDPVADFFLQYRIPRILSVTFVYIVFLGLVVLIGFLIVPPVTSQFEAIKSADVYQAFISKIGVYSENLSHSALGQAINNSFNDLANNFGGTLFATTRGVLTGIASLILVLVISFYLTVEENGMKNFIKHLSPYKHQAYVMKLVTKIQRKMGSWLLGQIILSAVIFGLVFIGLTVLNVQFALVLALVAGLLEIVPIIGPFIGLAIGVFFAFLQSPALALAVLILWFIILQLEAHVIVPILMSKSVGINPIMVILAVLVGATLGGVVGALIAIPVASGISVFINDIMDGQIGEPPA